MREPLSCIKRFFAACSVPEHAAFSSFLLLTSLDLVACSGTEQATGADNPQETFFYSLLG
jgi:hypothetical protein